jgi:hypothetical protein
MFPRRHDFQGPSKVVYCRVSSPSQQLRHTSQRGYALNPPGVRCANRLRRVRGTTYAHSAAGVLASVSLLYLLHLNFLTFLSLALDAHGLYF